LNNASAGWNALELGNLATGLEQCQVSHQDGDERLAERRERSSQSVARREPDAHWCLGARFRNPALSEAAHANLDRTHRRGGLESELDLSVGSDHGVSFAAPGDSLDVTGDPRRALNDHVFRNRLSGSTWSGWAEVSGGGITQSSVAPAVYNSQLYLFVRGTDDSIYVNRMYTRA
jgi:hypothetical protein